MLDRSRQFYTLSQNDDNIRYKQDGKFFYYNGQPVIEETIEEDIEVKKPAKKRGRKPAKKG